MKEQKLVHKEAWENVYARLTYFWDLYNGNVRKEILIFLILFEWKVLNRHIRPPWYKNIIAHISESPYKICNEKIYRLSPGSTQFVLAMSLSNGYRWKRPGAQTNFYFDKSQKLPAFSYGISPVFFTFFR